MVSRFDYKGRLQQVLHRQTADIETGQCKVQSDNEQMELSDWNLAQFDFPTTIFWCEPLWLQSIQSLRQNWRKSPQIQIPVKEDHPEGYRDQADQYLFCEEGKLKDIWPQIHRQ